MNNNKLREEVSDRRTLEEAGIGGRGGVRSNQPAPATSPTGTTGPNADAPSSGGFTKSKHEADWGEAYDNAQKKPTHEDGSTMTKEEYIQMMREKTRRRQYENRKNTINQRPPTFANENISNDIYETPQDVGRGMMDAGEDMIRGVRG